jgi:hypothetical protein
MRSLTFDCPGCGLVRITGLTVSYEQLKCIKCCNTMTRHRPEPKKDRKGRRWEAPGDGKKYPPEVARTRRMLAQRGELGLVFKWPIPTSDNIPHPFTCAVKQDSGLWVWAYRNDDKDLVVESAPAGWEPS